MPVEVFLLGWRHGFIYPGRAAINDSYFKQTRMTFDVWVGLCGLLLAVLAFLGIDHKVLKQGLNKAKPTRREIALSFVLVLEISLQFGYSHFSVRREISYIDSWGGQVGLPPDTVHLAVDGTKLTDRASKYEMAAVCFYHVSGNAEDETLQKSDEYDIEDSEIDMHITLDQAFVYQMHHGITGTTYLALLIPKGVTMSQFATLRQAYALGAISLGNRVGPP